MLAVIGQTGSGKSTLLQMINKLIVPQSGKVYLYETDVQSVRNIKRDQKTYRVCVPISGITII